MNSGDTPLNTAALLIEKQKTAQSPFVILSGGGQTFSTGWVIVVLVCSYNSIQPFCWSCYFYITHDFPSLLFSEVIYGVKSIFCSFCWTDVHVKLRINEENVCLQNIGAVSKSATRFQYFKVFLPYKPICCVISLFDLRVVDEFGVDE